MAVVYRRDLRSAGRLIAGAVAIFLLPHLALLAAPGDRPWSYLTYHATRGIHFESVLGNLLSLGSRISGSLLPVKMSYGAYHLVLAARTAQVASMAWLLAMLPLFYFILRSAFKWPSPTPSDAWRASALLLVTVVVWVLVSSKVLSGEYLIWPAFLFLIPTDKRWTARAALVILAGFLTKRFYRSYDSALAGDLGPSILLTVRNLLLLAAFALGLRSVADRNSRASVLHGG
jgi:hypothetical protein